MLIALFGDVHGNLPALELFIKATANVHRYLSMGDLVNYGPWSNECVQLVETLPSEARIMGNHETYFLQKSYPGTNEIAKAFFEFCSGDFREEAKIARYVDEYRFGGFRLLHTIDNKIIFHDTEIELKEDTIIAHSHQQYVSERNGFRLINPGSVGQNRAYINAINYIIWDTDFNVFEQCQLIYDVNIVINEMKARKYPSICLDYYQNKKRL